MPSATDLGEIMEPIPGPSSTATTPPSVHNLEAFKQLFPGVVQDGVLDAARLGEALGIDVAGIKDGKERFGLMWAGKAKAVEALQAPSYAALVPDLENSINWDSAENVFIEGDNLEVLKLLQNAYNDQVKLIYIDPPYNTGNDFVYNDDFSDPIKHYLEVTGQTDAEGNRLVANTEISGRKHSNWLTMMYPRLALARNLLSQDGVICVSIDDNEVHALRLLMDEIFGAENFVSQLVWQSRPTVQNDTDISVGHEYIIMYARNRRQANRRLKAQNAHTWFLEPTFAVRPLPTSSSRYKLDDGDGRGPYKEDPFDAPGIRPNLTYAIRPISGGAEHWPPAGRHWRTSEVEFEKLLADGRISFGSSGSGRPKLKVYLSEKEGFGEVPTALLLAADVGGAANGTRELQALYGGRSPFDTPKPTGLLRKILELTTAPGDIVLDFFAGSGSLGHAILALNEETGTKRKFILNTLAEEVAEGSSSKLMGFSNIAQVGLDRLKRCLPSITKDVGIRVLRLASSSFRVSTPRELESDHLNMFDTHTLLGGSNPFAISCEIGVKLGVPIDQVPSRDDVALTGAWILGDVLVVTHKQDIAAIIELAECASVRVIAALEDNFVGDDDHKANLFYACKKANITFKTF